MEEEVEVGKFYNFINSRDSSGQIGVWGWVLRCGVSGDSGMMGGFLF